MHEQGKSENERERVRVMMMVGRGGSDDYKEMMCQIKETLKLSLNLVKEV